MWTSLWVKHPEASSLRRASTLSWDFPPGNLLRSHGTDRRKIPPHFLRGGSGKVVIFKYAFLTRPALNRNYFANVEEGQYPTPVPTSLPVSPKGGKKQIWEALVKVISPRGSLKHCNRIIGLQNSSPAPRAHHHINVSCTITGSVIQLNELCISGDIFEEGHYSMLKVSILQKGSLLKF